jgi:hypothetical protein
MQNSNSIDPAHVRAITAEIGERLRLILPKEQPEPGSSLEQLISRLPELDERSPPITPEDQGWTNLAFHHCRHAIASGRSE